MTKDAQELDRAIAYADSFNPLLEKIFSGITSPRRGTSALDGATRPVVRDGKVIPQIDETKPD